jgi:F-type H+-transporting ATPase subunit epsilon
MSTNDLLLRLMDGARETTVDDVVSFVAEDASGQFGLRPGHEPLLTCLEPGLFRFLRRGQLTWSHGACTGGMLHGLRGTGGRHEVRLVSRRILLGDDLATLRTQLDAMLAQERSLRTSTLEQVERLDLAFQRRLQALAEQAS